MSARNPSHKWFPRGYIRDLAVAVDWLTITVSDTPGREMLLQKFQRIAEALSMMGETKKSWGVRDYRGFKCGGARWGTRRTDDILILSGVDAQAYWRIFAAHATNCSRLDLAVTCQTRRCYPHLLDTYLAEIREIEGYKTRGYRIDKDVQNFGKTLYVGSRASDQFGRVYDKAAEQRDPVNIHRRWRYEVEYKNDYAREGLDNLLSLDEPTDLPPLIQNTVWFWFDHRGIPPLFERTSGKTEFEVAAKVTDTSRRLSWLSTQVRPTIQELMRAGLEEDVFRALGISRGES